MYDRILVAIDFSEPSVDAFRWTVRRFPDAEITLFHAIEATPPPGYVRQVLDAGEVGLTDERELDARTNLEHLAEEAGVPVRTVVRAGWPPREVHVAAEETSSQAIVVGAHTRRIWPWDEPGATAAKIVEEAVLPVLVWRPGPRQAPAERRTVLAPVDLREGSEGTAREAARAARHFGARLLLVHVLPRTLQAYLRAVSTPTKVQETLRQVEQVARRQALDQLSAEEREELEVQALVCRGRPVTQVLAVAESEAANLIVMGQRHAPTRTGRALLGSVTDSVLRGANCAVLAVPL